MNQHSDPKYRKFRVERFCFFLIFFKKTGRNGAPTCGCFNRLDTGIVILTGRR